MKNCIFVICIVISQLFIACRSESETAHLSTIKLNPDYEKNSFEFEKIFKSVDIIPLKTDSNYIIGGVSKLIESSKFLFIMDDKNGKLVRFNMQGDFVNNIGALGKGPGEFLKIKDFTIDKTNKHVVVYDVRGRKIITYNFEGEFVREFNIEPFLNYIIVDSKGDYYGYVGSIANGSYLKQDELKKLKFVKFDKNGDVIDNITGHNNCRSRLDMYEHIFCQSDGIITFVEPLQSSIFKLENDIVKPYYSIDFKDHFVPDNVKKQLDSDDLFIFQDKTEFFQDANKKHILGLLKFYENEEWIVMQYMINYKYQFAFFNKQSEKLFESSGLPTSIKTKSIFFVPKYIDNNFIYSSQMAFSIIERYNHEKNDKNISDSRIKDWETFIDKIDKNDNPVIFRYELRM